MRGLAHVSSFIACGIILLTERNLILIVTVLTTAVATRFFFNALRKLLLDSSKIFFLVLCVLGYGNAGEKKKTHKGQKKGNEQGFSNARSGQPGRSTCNEQIVSFEQQQMCHGKFPMLRFCPSLATDFVIFPCFITRCILVRAKHIIWVSVKFLFPPRNGITFSISYCFLYQMLGLLLMARMIRKKLWLGS